MDEVLEQPADQAAEAPEQTYEHRVGAALLALIDILDKRVVPCPPDFRF